MDSGIQTLRSASSDHNGYIDEVVLYGPEAENWKAWFYKLSFCLISKTYQVDSHTVFNLILKSKCVVNAPYLHPQLSLVTKHCEFAPLMEVPEISRNNF